MENIKFKSFQVAKEIIMKTKRQTTNWENIFAYPMSDQGLISKHAKNSRNFTTITNKFLCGQKISKEHMQMANRHTGDVLHHLSKEKCKLKNSALTSNFYQNVNEISPHDYVYNLQSLFRIY